MRRPYLLGRDKRRQDSYELEARVRNFQHLSDVIYIGLIVRNNRVETRADDWRQWVECHKAIALNRVLSGDISSYDVRIRGNFSKAVYRVFKSFEDNAARDKQLPLASQTAKSRNLALIWLDNHVSK